MSNIFNRFGKSLNGEVQSFSNVKNSDYFTSEFEINDAPVGARNLLTKGFVQDEINHYSGAAITTRGRFISKNDHQKNPVDRPLYLFIQGPTKQSIELAIQKIHEIIRNDIGNPIRQGMNAMQGSSRSAGMTSQTVSKPPPLMGVSTNLTQVEKLYIGLDGVPASFDLRGKIIGPSGSNLHYIRSETGAAVTLRGRGSQFVEAASGREGAEPLHLYLEHPRPEGLSTARQLAVNLVETLVLELQQTDFPQQQIMNTPLQMSIPPPTQQHIAAPPQFSIDQPWMINAQNNQSGQTGGSSNQQQFQLQQVTLQPPPRPPTHVNIPPPGVHIPQHAGPLVPPPQLVQLSAPPPPTPNAPHTAPPVLVVGPPPPQPLYLPPDLVASSSLGTFSLVQGGLVYHQAPPVQTQAQIGDGQMMNAQQNDGTMSMNPHSQPPPQMIITQVQLDPNSQMITPNDQVSHNFQTSNQQKFHVIGHVQNQFNRDEGVQQSQQMMRQNQEGQNDNFSHYSTNQTTNPNATIMNSPYQTNMVGSNSHFSTVDQENQSQLRHINMGHHSAHLQQADQESAKQTSRQMQSGMNQQKLENQRQINTQMPPNQNQIQPNLPTNNYQSVSDNRSSQTLLSQMPPNRPPHQLISEGPPSNQLQGNNQFSNQQGNNQIPQNSMNSNQPSNQMTSPLQDSSQIAANQQQMRQMPPNQFPSDNNNQQPMNLQQVNQQMNPQSYSQQDTQQQPPNQRNFIQPFVSNQADLRQEPKRHENQARNKSSKGGRNRRGLRNNRQYVYPWSRSEQDRPNQQSDPVWQRKESVREFEYDRKVNEFQRNNSESRPSRFQPPDSDSVKPQLEDNRQSVQFRSDEDEIHNQQDNKSVKSNSSGAQISNNQSGQRVFPHQYGHGDSNQTMQLNRNRSDTEHQRKERSPEGGRKRKFEQESVWAGKPDNSDVGKSSHKKRFDQEDYKAGVAGCQSSGKSPNSKPFKLTESMKSEKSSFSKWSDKKGESVKKLEKPDRPDPKKEDHDGKEKLSPKKNDGQEEKANEKSTEAPWTEQRTEFKSNPVQYSNTNQFQGQSGQVVSDMGNRQYQQNYQHQPYMNTAQMFQGNLPYHLQPPPPPPPGQTQNNSIQLQPNMQFNLPQGNNNAPPNMLMANSNIHHGFGQNPLGHAMSNVSQNVHPNMNSNVPSQLQPNMTPNVGQNLHPNTQYDMSQNIMTNIAHHIVPNNNYILPPNMPPGINQNVPLNIGQNLHPNVGQNMSPNMGQIMPNQLQVMSQNMGQNIPHNLGQNLMPNMAQSPSSYMGHNVPNNIQHTLGQNVMNQNMNTNMGQSAPSNAVQNIPPNINQMSQQSMTGSMGQGMPSMMGTNSPNMNQNAPMNIPNNINQNMPMSMQSMGQMPHSMVPSMVPPPPNGVGPPPMMPPNMASRPHMAPPPPPPNVHSMTSQPPYPYWVN